MYGYEYNPFSFKNDHTNFVLRQYKFYPEQESLRDQLCAEITEDIGKALGDPNWLPDNVRPSMGLHEQLHPDDNGVNYYSCIPPHADNGHFAAITVFLNKEWDILHGGMNVCISKDEERVVKVTPIQYNTGVLIFCPTFHCTVPVYQLNHRRRTFQIFYTYVDD